MIRILLLILLFSALHGAVAAETPPQQSSGNDDTSPPIEKREDAVGQNPAAWPLPFSPSQSIGADSQVAFPTDI